MWYFFSLATNLLISVHSKCKNMNQASKRSTTIKERLFECVHNGELNNEDLFLIVGHLCKILNLKTIANYAKEKSLSYNGAKKRKCRFIQIDNSKFIIDNE